MIDPQIALAKALCESAGEVLSRQLDAPKAWALVRAKLVRHSAEPNPEVLRKLVEMGAIALDGFNRPMTRAMRLAGEMLIWSSELTEQAFARLERTPPYV